MSKAQRKQKPEAPAPRIRAPRSDPQTEPPAREVILAALREQGVPTHPDHLAQMLGVSSHNREGFNRRLLAMERDGQILTNRKGALCIVDKIDLITGTVQGHPDGFGFLIPDDGGPDLYLAPKEMHKVLHRDHVTARTIGVDRRGRPEGAIVDVLTRAHIRVVGRIYEDRGVWYLVAEDKRINQDLLVPPDARGKAQPGQVVIGEIFEQPTRHAPAIARVVDVLGDYGDPGMEIEIALRKHDLPFEFSAAAKRQATRLPEEVRPNDVKGHEDVRDLPLVTIDGETAKDFDDAVWCEPKGKGFRLVVAIADVSHYVKDGDALDRDSRERGNSVYFPRRVIPMLPEALSNNLCSLKPEVDRLCVVCDIAIDQFGNIKRYRFYPAVMHSRARLTYTQVAAWLEAPASTPPTHAALLPHLQNLHALYKTLVKTRNKRGAIDFETTETVLEFDEQGKIKSIRPVVRNDAHKLIEECMLAANVCAADYLIEHKHPALFRIHEGPTPEKLAALREFLNGFGLTLTGGDDPQAKDYAKLVAKIQDRPDSALLQTVLLRSLQQAIYSPENVGHFGLAYDAYAHFTSPIRRYPDLLVHRSIKAVLAEKHYQPDTPWDELGLYCSMTERRADEATRDVEAWLKCYFMQDRVGEIFSGVITGTTHFGIFVTLDELFVDGLVHISELGNDYFHFDAVRHSLTGERSGASFRLADRVRVQVARVDLETTKIDFVLAPEGERENEVEPPRKSQAKAAMR